MHYNCGSSQPFDYTCTQHKHISHHSLSFLCSQHHCLQRHKRCISTSCFVKHVLLKGGRGDAAVNRLVSVPFMRQCIYSALVAGVDVTVASVETTLEITASRSVKLVADKLIQECTGPYDCITLPVCAFSPVVCCHPCTAHFTDADHAVPLALNLQPALPPVLAGLLRIQMMWSITARVKPAPVIVQISAGRDAWC